MSSTRFLTFKQVRDCTGLSRSTIWRLERAGKFPNHHRISPNRVAWAESEINDWIKQMIQNTKQVTDLESEKEQSDE